MDKRVDRKLQRTLEEDPLLEAATEWFVELQGKDVPVERMLAWQRWLAGDQRHAAAYRDIESLWGSAGELDSSPWPAQDEVLSDRYNTDISISAWRARRPRRMAQLALAAGIVGVLAFGLTQMPALVDFVSPSQIAVHTQTGEKRDLRLSDGSSIAVGARSAISASLTPQTRSIRLDSGEAFFQVAKDAKRPFVVHAGGIAVTAIGTQFNVRHVDDRVVVAVAEGAVRVGALPPLTAGEQVNVAKTGTLKMRQAVDAATVGGWRSGKLQYLDEPLSSVVADVRRYASRDITIIEPAVGELRITGTVFENDVESWLRTLEMALPVTAAIDSAGKIVLSSKKMGAARSSDPK